MSLPGYVPGLPRIGSVVTATPRLIFKQGWNNELGGGKIIAGAKSRDPGNTGDINVLRAGLLMGKVTADGKYAPSIIGVMTQAQVATDTSVTVSAAAATEIVRRIGSTGTLRFVGPPSANGTVATFTETYSAVDTGTGVITVSGLDANLVAGSFVCANDGSYLPLTVIPDGTGIVVTDTDGSTSLDVQFPHVPISGVILSDNILPAWPSDTSLQDWIRDKMNLYGKFVFDYGFDA